MDIICCRSREDVALTAFRLRYLVYGAEIGVDDAAIDHERKIYTDEFDAVARIYVAIKDGAAIATCRSVYDRDYDFRRDLPRSIFDMLGLEKFLKEHAGTLAISTKFAISPSHRGSLAAHLVTAKMFDDIVDDGIDFVFSWCAPYLLGFYSQLGFHTYTNAISDKNGLWTPIVLATRNWEHLRDVKSPLYKQLEKKGLCERTHTSVDWFHDKFGNSLDTAAAVYNDSVLDKIFSLDGGGNSSKDLQNISIFNSMAAADVNKIIGSSRILSFAAGESIILTGQIQDEMFIILEGEVEATLETPRSPVLRFGPGHVLGEIALLTRAKRAADYRATIPSRLVFLTRQGLAKLMKVEPELSARLLYNISQSLSLKMLQTIDELRRLSS
jgi:hypothetical protein